MQEKRTTAPMPFESADTRRGDAIDDGPAFAPPKRPLSWYNERARDARTPEEADQWITQREWRREELKAEAETRQLRETVETMRRQMEEMASRFEQYKAEHAERQKQEAEAARQQSIANLFDEAEELMKEKSRIRSQNERITAMFGEPGEA